MLDKLLQGYKALTGSSKEAEQEAPTEAPKEDEVVEDAPKEVSPEALEEAKTLLKGIVYDDSLVEEYAPVFATLSGDEGFSKVVELLQAKEQQIQSLADGSVFKKQSKEADTTIEKEDPKDSEDDSVASFIKSKRK